MILEEQQLNPNTERICAHCGKLFKRKKYVSERAWEQKHKLCSRACIGFATNKGYREHGHRFWFTCCICGLEILGRKADLKLHKHEKHSH